MIVVFTFCHCLFLVVHIGKGEQPMFYKSLTLARDNSWTLLSSGECFWSDDKEYAYQFIVAFENTSNETKILANPLDFVPGRFHHEVNLNHLSRFDLEDFVLDECRLDVAFEAIHVIALYDEAYSSEPSSCSFVMNDLCSEYHRSQNRKVFMKCSNPNCPGIEVTSSEVADLITCCPCADA